MIFSTRTRGLLGGLLAVGAIAGPVVVRSPEIGSLSVLEERIPSITLGSFDLATSFEEKVLFDIGLGSSSGVGDAYQLEVTCLECRTWGSAVVSTAGATKDDSIIGDIISFFENPVDTIVEAFDLDIKIDFENVGGHFDFELYASDTLSYSFALFETDTAIGGACSDEVYVGLTLAIDLVFSLTAAIDLEGGFEFSFPEGAYITVNPLTGDIVDQGFGGGVVNSLPIIVTSGSAKFEAALRIRAGAGTTVELFGTGFDFELGVYADLCEYVAIISTTPECPLCITESFDLSIGAYAHAVAEIDYHSWSASPAVFVTISEYALASLCTTRPSLPPPPSSSTSCSESETTTSTETIPTQSTTSYNSTTSPTSAPVSSTTSHTATTSPWSYPNSTITSPPLTTSTVISTTITSPPSLTTSVVTTTTCITVTSCSSACLHCPASLTSEIVVTSTIVLYTTVCPVGSVQPTTFPASSKPTLPTSSAQGITPSKPTTLSSPHSLTPVATPVTETVYTPTYVTPTYAIPTATSFTVPYPNWPSTPTVASGLFPTSSPSGIPPPTYNSTGTGSVAPLKPTAPLTFTGAASRIGDNSLYGLVVFIGASLLAMI